MSHETAWNFVSLVLNEGRHLLHWTYEKRSGATTRADAAFLDNVAWPPLLLADVIECTNLVWTSGDDVPWFRQMAASKDGLDAV